MSTAVSYENIEIHSQYNTKHRTIDTIEKSKDVLFLKEIPSVLYERNNSTRFFSNTDLSIDTSSKLLTLKPNFRKKLFINVTDLDTDIKIKLVSLKRKVDKLIEFNNADEALVEIFKTLDRVYLDDNKCNYLFRMFMKSKFNDEISVGLLSATVNIKNNVYRKEFFNFVKDELYKKYSNKEVESILLGL